MKDFLKAVVFAGLFAVPFLTLYVENDYFFPFITGKNFWFRIIVDVVSASWIILALYDAKYRPKFSGIFASFGILLVIMFFANLFGKHPTSSFFSNFERMDGYISLIYTFLYALVLGSMLTTRTHWTYFLNTTLVVAAIVAIRGISQQFDPTITTARIDSTLGNAAYMAIYMLFHIFFAFWLFVESKGILKKCIYGLLVILFTYVMFETGTRGTLVGLGVGVVVMSAYIGLFGAQFKQYRKFAIGGFVLVAVAIAAFIIGRDSEFVQSNNNLSRYANISIGDLEIRGIIWGMAWEGVKERPLLGYGQSNFNYVFNENYDPRLYAQEQWFDRTHNIFMDWLIAGGFLGLIAYLSIFGWCVWYLLIRPIIRKNDESFSVLERGILLGILAGYFTHNLVVFDNIVSYIFFAAILGLIHSRVSQPVESVEKAKVEPLIVNQFAAPVMAVVLVAVIYFVHVPGMQAAAGIIDAFREPDPSARLEQFREVLNEDTFAQQEITEQLATQAMNISREPEVSPEVKQAFMTEAEERLLALAESKPGDARIHVFIASFYRSSGQLEKAAEQMAIARDLSPDKQSIITQQGFIALSQEQPQVASDFLKTAFELDERNLEAREYYAASLFYLDRGDEAMALMNSEAAEKAFAASDFLLNAANQADRTDVVAQLYQVRVDSEPDRTQSWRTDAQNWSSLAFLYYELDQREKAVETLNEAQAVIPSFAPTASCIAENIENDREPQAGC